VNTSPKTLTFLFLLFALISSTISPTAFASNSKTPPLSIPYPIESSGQRASLDFLIKEDGIYSLKIRYHVNEQQRHQVWEAAGGATKNARGEWIEPSSSIRLKVILFTIKGNTKTLLEESIHQSRLSSWGSHNLDAKLKDIKLEKGNYSLFIETITGSPQMKGIKSEIVVTKSYLGK
jgi:hypothetical protein